MPIVNKENSTEIVARVLHPVLYIKGAKGQMTVSTEMPEKGLFFKLLNLTAEDFGDREFKETYGVSYAIYGGDTASSDAVISFGKAGCVAAYDPEDRSAQALSQEIDNMKAALGEKPFLVKVDHETDMDLVRLLLDKGVRGVVASAFAAPSEALVYFRIKGLREEEGRIIVPHKIMAEGSGEDAMKNFVSPPAPEIVTALVKAGYITAEEAALAAKIPMADDLTVEADFSALPAKADLVDRLQSEFGYQQKVRVGVAGGIDSGTGCLGAFEMGAAYVGSGVSGDDPGKEAICCLHSCAYHYMRNLLIRIGASKNSFQNDIH